MRFLFRSLLLIAGLIFAASLIMVMLVLLLVWSVRAIWFKLTGRSAAPFAMRMNPRAGFDQVFRSGQPHSSETAKPPRRVVEDVTDLEPKR
jgi:hypothetical protein